MRKIVIILSLYLFTISSCAQQINIEDYSGDWKGTLNNTDNLSLDIFIKLKGENALFILSKTQNIATHTFKFKNTINFTLGSDLTFSGIVSKDKLTINGFIGFNRNLHPIELHKDKGSFKGTINLFSYSHLAPKHLDLKIKEVNENGYTVYPMLGAFWVMDFKHSENKIAFTDFKTGLTFDGQLHTSEIIFDILMMNTSIAKVSFKRPTEDLPTTISKQGIQINDGWKLSADCLKLIKMEKDIQSDSLVGMNGILIAKNNKIVYEKYFGGYNAEMLHTMMSASKSVSSAIIGIAIDDKVIENVDEKIYRYIEPEYQYTKDSLKSEITIKHLLTMSSGLDVNNQAQEDHYQQNAKESWLQTVLEAPMIHESGTYADYGSANPFLLGIYLNNRLNMPLEYYMHDKLFAPLGISNYVINTDDTGAIPYFGGGLQLRPRDMLKFGQLYLNEGKWNKKQVISKRWIEASFKKHVKLQDTKAKNEYGYLWWLDSYTVNGEIVTTMEARGAGGQFIFIIPELDAVVVITASNFRNRKGNQSREIFHKYILPTLLK